MQHPKPIASDISTECNQEGKLDMKLVTFFVSAAIFTVALATGFGQPTITKQPANQTASLFADVTFRVTAAGDAPLSYQWRFNDADLVGMTNTTLTVTNVQRSDALSYRVVV